MLTIKKQILILLLSLSFLGTFLLSSCKKDTGMEAILVVRLMSDTTVKVPDARVRMHKEDVDVLGYTNQNGEYRHTFDLPIQLDIIVTKDSLKGIGIINLGDPGKDVRKTIYIY
jgi:hypothetical protein